MLDHLQTPLVKWGWSPGDGRSTPPLSYSEFVNDMRNWADKGGACPDRGDVRDLRDRNVVNASSRPNMQCMSVRRNRQSASGEWIRIPRVECRP